MHLKRVSLLCAVSLLTGALTASAQDVEPRTLSPAPVGTNIVMLGFGYSWGEVVLDKTLPVQDLDGSLFTLIPSYHRFLSLFGATGRLSLAVPFATGSWDFLLNDEEVDEHNTGMGDPMASMMVFLVGAPAMTPVEFSKYRPKTRVGFNLRLKIPLGQYNPEQVANLGSNRWHVAPAVAFGQQLGRWDLQAYAGVWFFTDNTSLFPGENVLSQNPLYAFQANVAYLFRPRLWVSAGARQSFGGRVSVNGIAARDPQRNTRLGLVFGFPVAPRHTVRVFATFGPRTTLGNDFSRVMAQWTYAW